MAGLEGRTVCVRGWGRGYRDQQDEQKLWTAIFEIAANTNTLDSPCLECRCRFAKPWTSIATQRPPLLIVCLGLFGWIGAARTVRCEAIGKMWSDWEVERLFMLLDRSRGALCVVCRSVCVAPINLEQVCCVWRGRASEPKHIQWRKSWLCIGSLACGKATGS